MNKKQDLKSWKVKSMQGLIYLCVLRLWRIKMAQDPLISDRCVPPCALFIFVNASVLVQVYIKLSKSRKCTSCKCLVFIIDLTYFDHSFKPNNRLTMSVVLYEKSFSVWKLYAVLMRVYRTSFGFKCNIYTIYLRKILPWSWR